MGISKHEGELFGDKKTLFLRPLLAANATEIPFKIYFSNDKTFIRSGVRVPAPALLGNKPVSKY